MHTAIAQDSISKEIQKASDELVKIFEKNNLFVKTERLGNRYPSYGIKIIIEFKPIPNVFLTKKTNTTINLSDMELRKLNFETIAELDQFEKHYKAKNDSARDVFWNENPLFRGNPDTYSSKEIQDSINIHMVKEESIIDKIQKEKMYIYIRDYATKVDWVGDKYLRRFKKLKKYLMICISHKKD